MSGSGAEPFGFNVIGLATGNVGLGRAVREFIRALLARGESVRILDLATRDPRGNFDRTYDGYTVRAAADLPFAVNVFVISARDLYEFATAQPRGLRMDGRLNVAYVWWEVEEMPEHWRWAARTFDVLLAGSEFVGGILRSRVAGVPVVVMLHPCEAPEGIKADRARFNLPREGFVVCTGFDPSSDQARKNPFGAIEAFRLAFGDGGDGHLLIKVNNPETTTGAKQRTLLANMYSMIGGDQRVRVFMDRLPYGDLMALYSSCDAFISLHRSEGLGLAPLEAMRLGKPVVATGWSGNLSYMTHCNSCLVGFDFISTDESSVAYSPRLLGGRPYWADPHIDEAAAWLRRLADDPQLRGALGRRAASDTAEHDRRACEAGFVDEIQAIWNARAFLPPRDRERPLERARALRKEFLWRRMGMAARARHVERRLRHQFGRHFGWRFRKE